MSGAVCAAESAGDTGTGERIVGPSPLDDAGRAAVTSGKSFVDVEDHSSAAAAEAHSQTISHRQWDIPLPRGRRAAVTPGCRNRAVF
jgi:hypothetical protein